MKEICILLVKLHIIFSRMQRVNQHARPSIMQMGCRTCCYQVCALDHAKGGAPDLDYQSGPWHHNAVVDDALAPRAVSSLVAIVLTKQDNHPIHCGKLPLCMCISVA